MEAKAARSPRFQDFHVHVTACTLFSLPAYTYIYKIKQNTYSNKAFCYDLGQNAMRRFGLQCHKVLEYLADGACSEKARLLETWTWRSNLNSRLVLCVFVSCSPWSLSHLSSQSSTSRIQCLNTDPNCELKFSKIKSQWEKHNQTLKNKVIFSFKLILLGTVSL